MITEIHHRHSIQNTQISKTYDYDNEGRKGSRSSGTNRRSNGGSGSTSLTRTIGVRRRRKYDPTHSHRHFSLSLFSKTLTNSINGSDLNKEQGRIPKVDYFYVWLLLRDCDKCEGFGWAWWSSHGHVYVCNFYFSSLEYPSGALLFTSMPHSDIFRCFFHRPMGRMIYDSFFCQIIGPKLCFD